VIPVRDASQTADFVVVGSGIGGLAVAALLAKQGRHVAVLEADHEHVGGYARTFRDGEYRYTLGPRYVWDFGPDAIGARFLRKIGLADVEFMRLDHDGFDHLYLGSDGPLEVPMGWELYASVLGKLFPREAGAIAGFFEEAASVYRAIKRWQALDLYYQRPAMIARRLAGGEVSVADVSTFLRYATYTLHHLFERFELSKRVRALLSAQIALNLEAPATVSLLAYVAATLSYHEGAFYPVKHYEHLIASIVGSIRNNGGRVLTGARVTEICTEGGRAVGVRLADGSEIRSRNVISNIDPQATQQLLSPPGHRRIGRITRDDYGGSVLSLFLGVRGLRTRATKLGRCNLWYMEDEDVPSSVFGRDCDMQASPRYAYLNSPTLLSDQPGLAPAGCDVITAFVPCTYRQFAEYEAAGSATVARVVDSYKTVFGEFLQRHFAPGIMDSVDSFVIKTPLDCEREVGARYGNAYGVRFTRRVVFPRVRMTTAIPDLYCLSAFTSLPGLIPGILGASYLYRQLTGDRV